MMTNQTSPDKRNIAWLEMLVKLISLAEKLLPAFLMAWNQRLKDKNLELTREVERLKLERVIADEKAKIEKETSGRSSTDIVRDFLDRRKGG
jgi:hypothetical protein